MCSSDLNALAARGELETAVEQYREAARLNPGYAMAYNNLGVVSARQGRYAEASDYFRRALHIDPGLNDARKNLERVRRADGMQQGDKF